jgi:hypothetical protein
MPPPPLVADALRSPASRPGDAGAITGSAHRAGRDRPVTMLVAELRDPRLYQIGCLGGLLVFGVLRLDLEVRATHALLILVTVLVSQYAGARLGGGLRFDPRSALISGLSLCLLLRTNLPLLAVLTAGVAIGSKFLLRIRDKHVFNPTNFALVAMMALTDQVWVSPGQWGSGVFFAFLLACAGGLVVNRASRSDVTYAFIGFYAALILGRALWLGDPLVVPLHRLQNGALVLFTFFMISDPRTTPNSRAGRILFAFLVALGAWFIQFRLFRTNGLLWSLAVWSLAAPLIDRLLPGGRFEWRPPSVERRRVHMPGRHLVAGIILAATGLSASAALAFCGFYVAKADTKLFNRASKVVLARHEDKTVVTMANDFRGDPKEFAIVIPVPTVLEKDQIRVGDRALVEHVDAYSSPRLVEYFDTNPCERQVPRSAAPAGRVDAASAGAGGQPRDGLGVKIEARYTIGEYDILILSASQSSGLETWLRDNGYRIPTGASAVLGSYIRQNLKFFVARVNLTEQARLGYTYLRPLQMAFESPKFMLPIRLGTVNADGPQELFVFTLTRKGRVETTNYRTVRLPTDMELPLYVKEEFGPFYQAMFGTQVKQEDMRAVFLEYAWDMGWCDPCAADPLSNKELRELGAFWVEPAPPGPGAGPARRPGPPQGQAVYITRLHVRYDADRFPDDLVFQETADRANFQGRYVLRHPWTGNDECPEARPYREQVAQRREKEAQTLATLTGWNIDDIRRKMNLGPAAPKPDERKWWQKLWGS